MVAHYSAGHLLLTFPLGVRVIVEFSPDSHQPWYLRASGKDRCVEHNQELDYVKLHMKPTPSTDYTVQSSLMACCSAACMSATIPQRTVPTIPYVCPYPTDRPERISGIHNRAEDSVLGRFGGASAVVRGSAQEGAGDEPNIEQSIIERTEIRRAKKRKSRPGSLESISSHRDVRS